MSINLLDGAGQHDVAGWRSSFLASLGRTPAAERRYVGRTPMPSAPMNIPSSDKALVIRTDFSDDESWERVCSAILTPTVTLYGEHRAQVQFVSEPRWRGVTAEQIAQIASEETQHTFIFLADQKTFQRPEHPVLAVDVCGEPGRAFRVIPTQVVSVESNLSVANLDFAELADAVDEDGILRGIK
jgi:hypothetical protein